MDIAELVPEVAACSWWATIRWSGTGCVLLEVQDGIVVAGEAGDGPTAVSLATSLRPDIVPLVLKLPGMDGIEVLASLRSCGPLVLVLVLTSATQPSGAGQDPGGRVRGAPGGRGGGRLSPAASVVPGWLALAKEGGHALAGGRGL